MEKDPKGIGAEDVDLLRRAARGDPEAARIILDEHMPIVYGFVYARLYGDRATADDVMQETLMEGLKSAGSFKGEAKLSTWLCTIARRRIARHYEKERKQEVAASSLALVTDRVDELFDEQDRILRAIGSLPATHRQVLVMKYLDHLSVEEIASTLGRTRVQVQSLLQRARAGFKTKIEEADG